MQHPLEPVSRLLRLGLVTDTSVPIKGRPPNLLEVIRDRGWLQGLQKPTKEELTPFITERVFVAERYLHPPSRAPWPISTADVREHARAVLFSVVALWCTIPFTAVYVSAAAHMARYASLTPFSGNISALRLMAREGGIRSLWQGAVPLTIAHVVDEATYRLRLGRLPSAAAYLIVHLCEVVAIRKMCWDARYRLGGGMAGWSFGPFANFVTGYLLTLVVNMTGVGYYLPLSSTRIWLMAHPFDTLAETVRLGSYWSSALGMFRGVRASLWSLIPRVAIEFLVLKLARKVINRAFGINSKPKSVMETMMGGLLGGAGGPGGMGGMPPGFEAMMAGGAAGGGMPPGFPGMAGGGLGGARSADAPPPTAQITEPSSDINWVRSQREHGTWPPGAFESMASFSVVIESGNLNRHVWMQEIVLDLFDEGQLVVVMYFVPQSPECAVCFAGLVNTSSSA